MDTLKLSQPNAFVVSLRGKCEGEQDAKQLVELLWEATQKRANHLWLLCQELTHIDFRAQQALLHHLPFLQDARIKLRLCGLQPGVQRQLESTELSALIALLPSEAYTGPHPLLR